MVPVKFSWEENILINLDLPGLESVCWTIARFSELRPTMLAMHDMVERIKLFEGHATSWNFETGVWHL